VRRLVWAPRSVHREEPENRRRRRWPSRGGLAFAILAGVLVTGGAYAATNWVVGLSSGSTGQAESATISNLNISAVASPSPSNLLYPGGPGDVVATVQNPNPYPVTITAVLLPANTTYADGYTTSNLSTEQPGCLSSTPSDVIWNYSTATSGSSHNLTTPLTVAADGTLVVTFTNDATMTDNAPAACAATYFSMPALVGVTATGGAGTATSSPATDSWTS
jgi:hypothetical protein